MRLELRQSGGIGGLIRALELDTDGLPASDRAELLKLVADVQRGGGKAKQDSAQLRDAVGYELKVVDARRISTLAFSDSGMNRAQAELLAFLQPRMRAVPPRAGGPKAG